MHPESLEIMRSFVDRYLDRAVRLDVLDVGSCDVNGTYRPLFDCPNWTYAGLDLTHGPNVDIIATSPYDFGLDRHYDVVVSGNCMEHVEAPWKWVQAIHKVTRKGGLVCVITPFSLSEHRYPVDCWRILPDGYKYLFERESDFTVLETRLCVPSPRVVYRVCQQRPVMRRVLDCMPRKIQRVLRGQIPGISDTYAIARKN